MERDLGAAERVTLDAPGRDRRGGAHGGEVLT
jgi:hypothetical protein